MSFNTLATALVLLASPAMAELKLSGEAKMGLVFDGQDLAALSGAQVTAHAYGTTDGGLEYGIIMDMDVSNFNRDDDPRAQVYISSGGHNLRAGTGVKSAVTSLQGPSISDAPCCKLGY
ncbi:porin [Pseudorhodobacter turbinis]|uniref:Porin n=1 Tax=Pseudorhodobacter turbinis TaxID=2500533 RepID=A0A4P8EFN8_9RHOB|nr:porin [Pseudorhodobacter turbinis]QCO55686.1 porin [Pseudorhodobacter turbinis]